jgi:UDP-N-acetyl-D-galactosamine dehydrogenase
MLGITFKENCPDVRNTKIVDVVAALADYGINVTIYDPWANPADVLHEYGLTTHNSFPLSLNKLKTVTLSAVEGDNRQPTTKYDAVVLGVAHKEFMALDYTSLRKENSVVYDVKGILEVNVDGKL